MRRLMALMLLLLPGMVTAADCPKLLDHRFQTLQGKSLDLCQYRNSAILVVNTASKCGFTPQFDKLEALSRRYRDRGLLVVGFPSNDFRQELRSNAEIGSFCKLTYGVEFPMVAQGAVTGERAQPFFKQLKAASGRAPQWNFHKYVITPGAAAVHSFDSAVEPDAPEIMRVLQPHLQGER